MLMRPTFREPKFEGRNPWRNIMIVKTIYGDKLCLGTKAGLRQLDWGGNWAASVAALRAAYRAATARRTGSSTVSINQSDNDNDNDNDYEITVNFDISRAKIGCCVFDEKTFKLIMRTIGARKSSKKALAAKVGR